MIASVTTIFRISEPQDASSLTTDSPDAFGAIGANEELLSVDMSLHIPSPLEAVALLMFLGTCDGSVAVL